MPPVGMRWLLSFQWPKVDPPCVLNFAMSVTMIYSIQSFTIQHLKKPYSRNGKFNNYVLNILRAPYTHKYTVRHKAFCICFLWEKIGNENMFFIKLQTEFLSLAGTPQTHTKQLMEITDTIYMQIPHWTTATKRFRVKFKINYSRTKI